MPSDWVAMADATGTPGSEPPRFDRAGFEEQAESGRFLEIWNLVFMQYDRGRDGILTPLPRPSVDTGAGLERIASVLQGETDNFHTDLFRPLISEVERLVGAPYPGGPDGTGVSYRVLADHARAVSFLLLDGVLPGNEGRGFVLRRILRRAVRHAWLLGRREPTLTPLIPTVVALMGDAYPALREREVSITTWVQKEEESFLRTIEAGLSRLDDLFADGDRQISGDDAFLLYDTFGFPIDLTGIIAAEHGVTVDVEGFEQALAGQRQRSRAARHGSSSDGESAATIGSLTDDSGTTSFVGYTTLTCQTTVLSAAEAAASGVMILAESPFYATSGGQVADTGVIEGTGWRFVVNDVRKDAEHGQRIEPMPDAQHQRTRCSERRSCLHDLAKSTTSAHASEPRPTKDESQQP